MWKHAYNAEPSKGQNFTMPSQTIQGQTISIAKMLERVQNGIPLDIRYVEYGEDEEPQISVKDLTDVDQIAEAISESRMKLAEAQKLMLQKQKDADKKAMLEEAKKALEEERKNKQPAEPNGD